MKIETIIDERNAIIKIQLTKKKSKYENPLSINSFNARELLLKQHPDLKVTRKPEKLLTIDNTTNQLSGEWKFAIIKEDKEKIPEQKTLQAEQKKTIKKQKNILTFKPKDAKVEETTQPDLEAKGVEEPTE